MITKISVEKPKPVSGSIIVGNRTHGWALWDGHQLRKCFALDCETELIVAHETPKLAMVSVSDGQQTFVLRPDQLPAFIEKHLAVGGRAGRHLVAHNVAFDFWVIDRYLADMGHTVARDWLWSAVDEGRVHDTMLLGGLVSLAQRDDDQLPSLATAVKQHLGYELEKDTYRTRYAETMGVDWRQLDRGFFEYAAADAISCYQLYRKLKHIANDIVTHHDSCRKHGFLTEAIQVKAAICLAAIERAGLNVDLVRARELKQKVDSDLQDSIARLQEFAGDNVWHSYKKTGERKRNPTTGLPQMKMEVLQERLLDAAGELEITPAKTKTGKVTTSVKEFWNEHRHKHPLIEAYCDFTEHNKLRTFFEKLHQPTIHPRYRVFVRTGRTSCSAPNIQQLPRAAGMREVITARPGHVFFMIDYAAVELVTLAAECQARYGSSKLGDVLRQGIDPHRYTAAMFAGVSLDQFNQLPDAKSLRQRAKAINFGIPGGLGADSLVNYAKLTYGVEMTTEEATTFRRKLTEEVYPELGQYLSEDTASIVAGKLQTDRADVNRVWDHPASFPMMKKILEGRPYKTDGTPYKQRRVNQLWQELAAINRNPNLKQAIQERDTSPNSPLRRLLYVPVTTLTGRLRGGVSFTAARNTPFQGLAADGAKLAMWELLKAGYRIVAFVHDEFIIELPKKSDYTTDARRIDDICRQAMQGLVGDIPVKCEFAVAGRWYKESEAVFKDGELEEWKPEVNH